MGKRNVFAALVFLCVLISTHAQTARYFLYVTNTVSNTISAYVMEPNTGRLSAVAGSPFAAGPSPGAGMAVDPAGRFLYVPNEAGKNVSGYSINPTTGALAAMSGSPFPVGKHPLGIAMEKTGKSLYVANDDSGDVSAFFVNPNTGALTAARGSPFAVGKYGSYPTGIAVAPTGKFLYVTNNGSANVSAYTVNPGTGALTAVGGSPFAAGSSPLGVAQLELEESCPRLSLE